MPYTEMASIDTHFEDGLKLFFTLSLTSAVKETQPPFFKAAKEQTVVIKTDTRRLFLYLPGWCLYPGGGLPAQRCSGH